MITHTITALELAWTVIGFIGLIFAILLLSRSTGDYQFLRHHNINGVRRYSVLTSMIIFLGGVITQLSYVIVGSIAMTQPSPHNQITSANIAVSTIFMAASIIGMIFATLIYHRRMRLLDMIDEYIPLRLSENKGEIL